MFGIFSRIGSFILSIFVFIGSIIGIPTSPRGEELDLSGYELIFKDDFNGNSINSENWSAHMDSDTTKTRHGGYWNSSLAEVKDGALHIYTKYLENGVNEGDPAGWYSAAFDTRGKFEQECGYFEVRAICPKGKGQWAAYWLLGDDMTNVDGSGEDGAEIDILESAFYWKGLFKNAVSHCIHYDGYGEGHKSTVARQYAVDGDPYNEYNTYGLMWTEEEYIFYINGVESYRTSYGKTPKVEQYMLLSVEVGGSDGNPRLSWAGPAFDSQHDQDHVSDFIVDYVKVYELA